MIIDADGHLFETEEVFEKYMEPPLRNYRPRLVGDEEGANFWVFDGTTRYKRPSILGAGNPRSEEHTSELQSRLHLVGRLLLEKKNEMRAPRSSIAALSCVRHTAHTSTTS